MTKSKNSKAKGPSSRAPRHPVPSSSRPGRYSAPAASTRVLQSSRPSISGSPYSGDGVIRVKHREYIGEIPGSVAFSATSYSINPGLSTTFPWLAAMAANYESYRFKNLSFEFETEKSSSTAGSVMLAVVFDAADTTPATKSAMMTYNNAVRSAPWCPCAYRSAGPDLHKFGTQRYNRASALAANLDIKTYDVGNLIVATSGCADTTTVGELYVTYEVELHTPQQNAAGTSAGQILAGASGTTGSSWLGTTPTSTGTAVFTGTGNTLTCVTAGTYWIGRAFNTATSVTTAAPTGTATITAGLLQVSGNGTNVYGVTDKVVATVGQTYIMNETGVGAWTSAKLLISSGF